jgi:hypothetical protein
LIDATDYPAYACTHNTSDCHTHWTQGYSQSGTSSESTY